MTQQLCMAECCFVRSRKWFRLNGLEPEVVRRALVVADGRSNLSARAQIVFEKLRITDNLNRAAICEDCRERIGESIAMGETVVSLRSSVQGGGYGLFTVVDRAAGDWLTHYGGEIMSKLPVAGAIRRGLQVSHVMMVTRHHSINGLQNYRETVPGVRWKGLAQFINKWSESRADSNVKWRKDAPTLRCEARASKPIAAGTELIAHYEIWDTKCGQARQHTGNKAKEKRLHVKLKRCLSPNMVADYRRSLLATPRTRRRPDILTL